MKTLLKIFAALIILIIALLLILPIVYKSEIVSLTKNELNKNINATVDFKDIDLSLFKSFPNFNISIYSFNIVGNDEFQDDTLITIKRISMAIDILSVINSDNYKIKSIKLFDPIVSIIILKNGKVNYDIRLPDASSNKDLSVDNTVTGFNLDIDKLHISNGKLDYYDAMFNTQINFTGFHHTLKGKLSADNAVLYTNTKIDNLCVKYHDISYITNASVVYKASIDADMKNEIYKLGKNELIVNELFASFDGAVSFVEDQPNIILTFKSKGNKFKDILSLIPTIYSTNFEEIKTDGIFSIEGFIKGTYNENHIPSFNLTTSIDNAMFQYANLPESVNNINVKANISNKGGNIDNTVIDISKLELSLGNNPIVAAVKVSTPISDPKINTKVIGEINLADIENYYPIDDTLTGNISFNVKFDGQLSTIENITKGNNDFIAMGSILARDIKYNTSIISSPINIEVAQLNISPQYLDLVSFRATVDKNDIHAIGKINNYLPYYFNKGNLSGSIMLNSNYLNIDKLLLDYNDKKALSVDDKSFAKHNIETKSSSIVEIPSNINFTVSTKFTNLIYDSLKMSNVSGKLIIADKILQLHDLTMDAVGGKMTINGSYSTSDIDKPKVDFQLNMTNLSIPEAYNNFAIVKRYLPMAKKTTGLFSADFNLNTILDTDMIPVFSTMNGKGTLSATKIIIDDLNSLTQIAEELKLIELNKLEIDKIHLNFEFIEGKLKVKPTKFRYQDIDAEIEGWTSFDKSIEYTLNLEVPRTNFGSDANKVIDGLLNQVNKNGANLSISSIIPISISIKGTYDNPKINTTFTSTNNATVSKKTEEIINKEIEKGIDKLSKGILGL